MRSGPGIISGARLIIARGRLCASYCPSAAGRRSPECNGIIKMQRMRAALAPVLFARRKKALVWKAGGRGAPAAGNQFAGRRGARAPARSIGLVTSRGLFTLAPGSSPRPRRKEPRRRIECRAPLSRLRAHDAGLRDSEPRSSSSEADSRGWEFFEAGTRDAAEPCMRKNN